MAILKCLNTIVIENKKYIIMTDSKYSYDSVTKFAKKWETNEQKLF